MSVRDVVQAAAGVGGDKLYVEDVFSTYLYTGNSSTQTNANGIDLNGEGGLLWLKWRSGSNAFGHALYDSERGITKELKTETTGAQSTQNRISSFNSSGFTLTSNTETNYAGDKYASWTFRKAPKFFSVVTWSGNDVLGREIAHDLGSTPGCIIVKKTNGTYNWQIYHNAVGATKFLEFNTLQAQTSSAVWNDTAPTDSVFTVGNEYGVNQSGSTYVAYLFAHDAGGFGDDGEQNVISCGSYTGTGSSQTLNLGFEPQWILIKQSSGANDWNIWDNMRGLTVGGTDTYLRPNLAQAEDSSGSYDFLSPTATGVIVDPLGQGYNYVNTSGQTYIYIAIRRGPMKTPESGTEVFAVAPRSSTAGYNYAFVSNFPVDMGMSRNVVGATEMRLGSRLQGDVYLQTPLTSAEASSASWYQGDSMNSVGLGFSKNNEVPIEKYGWMFRRAPSFMDVVATPQTAAGYGTVTHNLGVAPEFIILKGRDYTESWRCYHAALGRGAGVQLNLPDARFLAADYWGAADPTATEFGVYWGYFTAPNYIAYLFASCPGVSKVSSYTGTGADLNVDCGFSAGARFILIKRTDPGSTGDWYVWDSARGIVAGNDPYLLLNDTAAEVTATDYIDPLSSGFTVTSSAPAALNASGGTYIFLAIS